MIKKMKVMQPNCPDLPRFFREYDPHCKRMFHKLELMIILDVSQTAAASALSLKNLDDICQANSYEEQIFKDHVSIQFLFKSILAHRDCVTSWQQKTKIEMLANYSNYDASW